MKVRTKSLKNQPVDYTLLLFVEVTITRKRRNVRSKSIIKVSVHDIDGSLKPRNRTYQQTTNLNKSLDYIP